MDHQLFDRRMLDMMVSVMMIEEQCQADEHDIVRVIGEFLYFPEISG